jgi:uracil-DNA glycosylase family 4
MTSVSAKKEATFSKLVKEARACILCPRMSSSVRVVGPASGSLDAPILIIGEAPGRLGADASAIPFHGDKAGDNFEALLEQVGLSRHDCFITNAALCNPKNEDGNNATPSKTELHNCSNFLRRQIDIVNPLIVVTLGAQALAAIRSIEDHDLELAVSVRTVTRWYGRNLIALYHPGQRAMIHRSFFNQLADYQLLAETFARLGRAPKPRSVKPTSNAIASIAERLVGETEGVSYFALHKLFYLAEYEFFRQTRRRMTGAYIVRQKEGPYVFEMHIKKLKKAIKHLETWTKGDRLMLRVARRADLFGPNSRTEFDDVLDKVIDRYGSYSDSDLKRVVYLTAPMRHLLRREKGSGENTFNRPIDFSVIDAQ